MRSLDPLKYILSIPKDNLHHPTQWDTIEVLGIYTSSLFGLTLAMKERYIPSAYYSAEYPGGPSCPLATTPTRKAIYKDSLEILPVAYLAATSINPVTPPTLTRETHPILQNHRRNQGENSVL